MEFRNLTPFPALAFQGIDQHDQAFHVIVLKQTLTWNDTGAVIYADEQQPLCTADRFCGEPNLSHVRQESDLCHYKPKCDVIVNAVAYAPPGIATVRFPVRLQVTRPNPTARLNKPYGLNPLDQAKEVDLRQWEIDVARLKEGEVIIDKQLSVTGPRVFKEQVTILGGFRNFIRKLIGQPPRVSTAWQLSEPQPITFLPLRYEYAYGGQCRINEGDAGANKVDVRYRLSVIELANHPDKDAPSELQPIAHTTYEANPHGMGYVENWYLCATQLKQIPAPQIEYADQPLTVEQWLQAFDANDRDNAGITVLQPVGFGIRYKAHPERRKLLGTVDAAFVESDAWLPHDFNFAIWNCAPTDQQCDYLHGDELITLTNLCDPKHPATKPTPSGHAQLQLKLPGNLPFVVVRLANGAIGELNAQLDTVIIEPEQQTLTCTWRAVMAMQPEVRVLEARMLMQEEVERFRASAKLKEETTRDTEISTASHDLARQEVKEPEHG
jgi:hypothetical protein